VAPFDYIAARLVGRWRSGAPVVRTPSGDSTALAVDDRLNNDFRFRTASAPLQLKPDQRLPPSNFAPAVEDKDGTICPFAAHIRKVNPRADPTEQSGPADTLTRLIIRRGIPYGPALPNFQIAADDGIERGLLFLCYQASIEQQFEFLMSQWVNRIDTPHPSGGRDALIGRHSPDANLPPSEITLTGADGQPRKLPLISNWITPVGGGYFFAPSLTAIRERLTV
jgi:Dyp-type peroxidase family